MVLSLFKSKSKPKEVVKKTRFNDEIESLIDKEVVESRYPFVFELNRENIASGGNYLKPYVVVSYPTEPVGNWLSPLKRMKGNISWTQHLEPANGELLNHHYNETIKNKEAELLRTLDYQRRQELSKEIKTAQRQLDQSLDEKSAFVYLYTYIMLQAQSETELNTLEESLNRVLIKTNLKAITPYRRIEDAYFSTFPISLNKLPEYTYHMTNSVSASSFFPFDDNEICVLTDTSTIEGLNKETNSYISIDYKNPKVTLNRNGAILGTSGVGKSTLLTSKFLRMAAGGEDHIYLIDPEDEQSDRVRKLGGVVIDLSSSSPIRMNIFEILSQALESDRDDEFRGRQLTDGEVEALIRQKVNRLKGFHKVSMSDMNEVQLSIISNISMQLYGKFREIKDLDKMTHTDWPILEDLYNRLNDLKEIDPEKYDQIKKYCFILEDMVHGSSTIFNGHTNIKLDSQITSFNLKPLQTEKEIASAAYFNIFSYLWEVFTSDRTRSDMLFCDEFHFLLRNPESADFFHQAYKRFRKYSAGAIVTTQQVEDILDAPNNIGKAIIGNSYTKFLFGFEDNEVDEIINRLKIPLSEKEQDFLKARKQGEALVLYGRKRAFMKVDLTEEELRILNPDAYELKTGKNANDLPDWSERVLLSQNEITQLSNEFSKVEGF